MYRNACIRLLLLIALVGLIAACQTSPQQPLDSLPTPEKSITIQPTPTVHIQPSATPTRMATRTPTPTAIPTPTPYPTLAQEPMEDLVIEVLANNGGCDLPCWWGITPGETRWDTAVQTFMQRKVWMGETGNLALHYESEVYQGRPWYTKLMEAQLWHEEGIIHGFDIQNTRYAPLDENFTTLWQYYALQPILARYGVPSQVYFDLTLGSPCVGAGNFPHYKMWVMYEEQGFAIRYSGLLVHEYETWHVCPLFGQTRDIRIQAQSLLSGATWIDPFAEVYDIGGEFSTYGTLSELSDMTLDAFYEAFRRPDPQTCVMIPVARPYYTTRTQSTVAPLAKEAENALLTEMLKHNGGCDLPCWWGITPGETRWADAEAQFLAYGKNVVHLEENQSLWGTDHATTLFWRRDPYPYDYIVAHHFSEKDGLVSLISIQGHTSGWPTQIRPVPQHFTQNWQRYTLAQVLQRYGKPSEILLHYWRDMIAPYGVRLVYEERNFVIEYMGLSGGEFPPDQYDYDSVSICIGENRLTDINLWLMAPAVREGTSLSDMFRDSGGGYLQLTRSISRPTLEEATGMSVDEFYRIFLNPGVERCLEADGTLGDHAP